MKRFVDNGDYGKKGSMMGLDDCTCEEGDVVELSVTIPPTGKPVIHVNVNDQCIFRMCRIDPKKFELTKGKGF